VARATVQVKLFDEEDAGGTGEEGVVSADDVRESLRRLDFERRNLCSWCGRLVGVHRLVADHPLGAEYGRVCDECIEEVRQLVPPP